MFPQTIRTWIIENVKVFGYYKKKQSKIQAFLCYWNMMIKVLWIKHVGGQFEINDFKKLFKTGPDDQDCSPDAGFVWFVIIIDFVFLSTECSYQSPPPRP